MRFGLIFCLAIFCIAFMGGCSHRANSGILDDVDTILAEQPDSALLVLVSLDTNRLQSDLDKARYNLLMAEARDKAGLHDTVSNYVDRAVKYFKDHGSRRDAARAYYYSGLVKFNKKLYSSSMVDLLQAERISKEERDTLQLAFIYKAIGNNFRQTTDLNSSLSYYRKSHEYFEAAGDINNADSVRIDISQSDEIEDVISKINIGSIIFDLKSLIKNGKLEETLELFYSNPEMQNNLISTPALTNLGAEVIAYKQLEEDLLKESNRRERLFWIAIVILSLLSVLLVYILIIRRNKALRMDRDFYMMAVDDLDRALNSATLRSKEREDKQYNEIISLQSALNESKNTIRNLLVAQFADLSELCQIYFQFDNHKNAKIKVYNKVKELVTRFNSDDRFNKSLENTINRSLGDLMMSFRKDFPNLNEWEYPLFMYNVCGMGPGVIALFLGERAELIYKRKANLKRKIANSSAHFKDEYLLYLS